MPKASDFTTYLEEAVFRHDIYVLGAQGERVTDIMPKIPSMETTSNVKNILSLLSDRLREGYDATVMRAFDCSGLGVYYFLAKGLINSDTTADGLYKKCTKIAKKDLKMGDMVFQEGTKKVDNKPVSYMHHVGYYIGDGKVIESKGRLYGVVKTDIDKSGYTWTHFGRPSWWDPEDVIIKRKLKVTDPEMTGDDVKEVQTKLKELGYEIGTIDGIYGTKTETAVKKFQKEAKVSYPRSLGVVGKTTTLALGFKWEG